MAGAKYSDGRPRGLRGKRQILESEFFWPRVDERCRRQGCRRVRGQGALTPWDDSRPRYLVQGEVPFGEFVFEGAASSGCVRSVSGIGQKRLESHVWKPNRGSTKIVRTR